MQVIQYIVNLGASVMIPIIIFILGLCLRTGVGKSLRAGISIGIGFVGINLVVGLLTDNLGSAAKAMARNFHLGLSVVDIGWPGTSPMAWASVVGLIAIPISILVNLAMLLTKSTKVINVDIWNVWHFAFTGAFVLTATGSYTWAIIAIIIHSIIAFKIGDMFTPVTNEFFDMEGISIPHGDTGINGVFAKPIDDLIELIPGVRNINLSTETIQKKFGIFGQPSIIGAVLGLIIGLMAQFSVGKSLQLAIEMAAVMELMPVVVKYIMQGLMPISEAAQKTFNKHFKGATFTIGMDPALLLGNSDVISASLLFVPITLLLAVIVPGNKVLPFGDLATIGYFVALAVGVHKGNLFRTIISGSVFMSMTIWIANQTYPILDKLGRATHVLGSGKTVASLDQGGNQVTYLINQLITGKFSVGFFVIFILWVGAFIYTYVSYKRGTLYKKNEKNSEQIDKK